MQDNEDKGGKAASDKAASDKAASDKAPRRDRLKLALRENLKRRKAQARRRNDSSAAPSADAKASLDDADNEGSG